METSARQRRERLKEILAGSRCVTAGSVFDPISARIAEDVGLDVGMLGGSVASLAVLGAPDLTLITLSELADQTRRVCRAGTLPVVVDADHGYGNALNVMRTVAELSNAGAAALSIEDTALPRNFGSSAQPELISIEEGVGKMHAATMEAKDTGILVFARTSAASIIGIDEAITRFKAYEAAGVDALFIPALETRFQLEQISAEVKLPVILGPSDTDLRDTEYLADRRVRVYFGGHQAFLAAVKAIHDVALAIRGGAAPGALPGIADESLLARLTRRAEYQALDRFLKPSPD